MENAPIESRIYEIAIIIEKIFSNLWFLTYVRPLVFFLLCYVCVKHKEKMVKKSSQEQETAANIHGIQVFYSRIVSHEEFIVTIFSKKKLVYFNEFYQNLDTNGN